MTNSLPDTVRLTATKEQGTPSPAKAWLRALELTAPIPKNPHRTFPVVIEELAEQFGSAPALSSETECFTYRELLERANRYARWALDQGLAKGETVCLFMPNRPEYMAIWLGITRVGGVVALLNTNLVGASLAHCIDAVQPSHVIVAGELADRFKTAPPAETSPKIWIHGIDPIIENYSGAALRPEELRPVTIQDTALYIYTSGTTGLPKAARLSHFRIMQWSNWFAGLMNVSPSDRMYNCLPMYHSVGGCVATGAVLARGGMVVVREGFSASQFWKDIVRWDCTLFQYIGELCRYLLNTDAGPHAAQHRIRMCCGNGLGPDIWNTFKTRFGIPQILEFYASTEGNVSLFNVDGREGSIGRTPSFLAHRFQATLVRFDVEKQAPIRSEDGFCIRCEANEPGEALGKILPVASDLLHAFDGYTSTEATEAKILHNVFEPGDRWFRTGDLMRKDDKGYFYFVDRIGDTYRWKGENVASSEVSEAICSFPGIKEASVYGVAIPNADGRTGMAAVVTDDAFELAAFRKHLMGRLPTFAQPLFLRIRSDLPVTATFKHTKNDLQQQGYNPAVTSDAVYFNDPKCGAFVRLDQTLYNRIQTGQIRL